MNYGLYLAAAGTLSSMHRQDVLANNLANMNTTGFKPSTVTLKERLPERLSSASLADPKYLLERLGGGHFVEPTRLDVKQGPLRSTGGDLDVAIEGDGFFVVDVGGGRRSREQRLTRDGRFTMNRRRELVTAAEGYRVLNTRNRPIRLDPEARVTINRDGEILQNGDLVARIRTVNPPDPGSLVKTGNNLMRLPSGGDMSRLPAANSVVHQGFIETSAVEAITTLNNLTNAAKAAQANIKMMQYHDHLLGQTFTTFGRVA